MALRFSRGAETLKQGKEKTMQKAPYVYKENFGYHGTAAAKLEGGRLQMKFPDKWGGHGDEILWFSSDLKEAACFGDSPITYIYRARMPYGCFLIAKDEIELTPRDPRKRLMALLEQNGIDVDEAYCGLRALELLGEKLDYKFDAWQHSKSKTREMLIKNRLYGMWKPSVYAERGGVIYMIWREQSAQDIHLHSAWHFAEWPRKLLAEF